MMLLLAMLAAPQPAQPTAYGRDPVDIIIRDLREVSRKVDAVQDDVSEIKQNQVKTETQAAALKETVGELRQSVAGQDEKISNLDKALTVLQTQWAANGFTIGGTTGLVTLIGIVLHNLRTRKRIKKETGT